MRGVVCDEVADQCGIRRERAPNRIELQRLDGRHRRILGVGGLHARHQRLVSPACLANVVVELSRKGEASLLLRLHHLHAQGLGFLRRKRVPRAARGHVGVAHHLEKNSRTGTLGDRERLLVAAVFDQQLEEHVEGRR